MKKLSYYGYFFISVVLFFTFSCDTCAAKKGLQGTIPNNTSYKAKPVNNEGGEVIFGSILDPNVNQVLLLLPKPLLTAIRKLGQSKIKVTVSSNLNSTKIFSAPVSAINIQTKRLNNRVGKYLVVNLFNLTTPSGVTISPSSLPSDDYKLRITGTSLDLTTDSFNYQTPILIVGTIESTSPGLISVEDLNGNIISEKTVIANPKGIFFTEVRANRISQRNSTGDLRDKKLKQISSESNFDGSNKAIEVGQIHAVAEKDFYAIVLLSNDVKANSVKIDKPVILSETTTLTASLGNNYNELAKAAAQDQLENLSIIESKEGTIGFGCDIDQFSEQCSQSLTNQDLASIGTDFKNFIQNSSCNFPEFNLIKLILQASPDEINPQLGKGYCDYVLGREIDQDKPCKAYEEVLNTYNNGLLQRLPCPPEICTQFKGIKLPKCFTPVKLCEEQESNTSSLCQGAKCKGLNTFPLCINKPTKDPYCARIGTEITEEECLESPSSSSSSTWSIVTSTKGNKFCVPAGLPSILIQDDCELKECHDACEEQLISAIQKSSEQDLETLKKESSDCHISCDLEAGRFYECNPASKFFSNKCCENGLIITPSIKDQPLATRLAEPNLADSKTPFKLNLRECLCNSTNNFEKNGYVKENAQLTCKKCPEGYETAPTSDIICLPICPEDFVRDQRGFCRKNCPKGFVEDDLGNCNCPEGQTLNETENKCINQPLTCVEGQKKDLITGLCIPLCGLDQYLDPNGECRCNADGKVVGSVGCKKQNQCTGNMLPNNILGEAACICPTGLSYLDGENCVAKCPNGTSPANLSTVSPPKSPIHCSNEKKYCGLSDIPTKNSCICAQGAIAISPNGECKCPKGQTYSSLGCNPAICGFGEVSTADNPCTCASGATATGPGGVCTCSDGLAYKGTAGCGTPGPRVCQRSEVPQQGDCTCALGATATSPSGVCACSSGLAYKGIAGCGTPGPRVCQRSEVPQQGDCTCASSATATGPSGVCACSSGLAYKGIAGCGNPGPRVCDRGEVPQDGDCACASPATATGPGGVCACSGGLAYQGASGCATSVLDPATSPRVCQRGEVPSQGNCTCASPATATGPGGVCACSGGLAYKGTAGCGTPGPRLCSGGEVSQNGDCACASPATATGPGGVCACSGGLAYKGTTGCGTPDLRSCERGEVPSQGNCTCASPATATGPGGVCACSGGLAYKGTTGCGTPGPRLCSGGEVPQNGDCTCANPATATGIGGVCACPSGQTYSESGCN